MTNDEFDNKDTDEELARQLTTELAAIAARIEILKKRAGPSRVGRFYSLAFTAAEEARLWMLADEALIDKELGA